MATLLPELLLPPSIPPFLSVSHVFELIDVYAMVAWSTGHDTKRRTYTTAPKIASVELDLSQSEMTDFHYWYEGPGKLGSAYFSVQLANFGPGLIWYKARFYETYTATPDEIGTRWNVKFRLYLVGDGSFDPPVITSAMSTRLLVLTGTATPTGHTSFNSTRYLRLALLDTLSSTHRLVLRGVPDSDYILEEDDFYILQEDGISGITTEP